MKFKNNFNMQKCNWMALMALVLSVVVGGCNSPEPSTDKPQAESAPVQHTRLENRLDSLVKHYQDSATLGISLQHLESGYAFALNDEQHYPMQSVFKFPLGMAVLDLVDQGILHLDQQIAVPKADLLENTWSPLRDKYPKGGAVVSLADLIDYAVAQSDNNACDILFRMAGGPSAVQEYLLKIKAHDIAIVANEADMAKDWETQYRNWSRPSAMTNLLNLLHGGKTLSDSSSRFLMRTLVHTSTGPMRLKGLLPEGTVVAHKTGTGPQNEQGMISATNDAGIITLPDGSHVTLTVFVMDSKSTYESNERMIAETAKLVWDEFAGGRNIGKEKKP